ncbi:hypothetical protein [Nonomuraea jabiensis]|uniref:hypothetical protein n=1 Tax=Nonomuraea jabiensis TaxID=882448 RepID=UPI003D70A0BF
MEFAIPVLERGPFELPRLLEGLDDSPTTIGCDASVTTLDDDEGHGGYAVWATVSGDGLAQFGWYEADATIADLAELNAVRHVLARYPSGRDAATRIDVITDSSISVALAVRLSRGRGLGRIARANHLHPQLLEAARAECMSRPFWATCLPGDDGRHLSEHRLVAAAHHVAWGVRRVLQDDMPFDANALEFIARLGEKRTRSKAWARAAYREWQQNNFDLGTQSQGHQESPAATPSG